MPKIIQSSLDNDVLDNVMHLFWHQGYASTSIEDIVEKTGLHRSAIYKYFKDKEGLFLAMLKRFHAQVTTQFTAPLCLEQRGVESIKNFFSQFLPLSEQNQSSDGCFLIATASDLSSHSQAVQVFIADFLNYLRSLFVRQLCYDQAQHQLDDTLDSQATADFLVGNVFGLFNLFRAHAPKTMLVNQILGVMQYLDSLILHKP